MNHINYLICVYKFCKNAKFVKLELRENFPVYGISFKNGRYEVQLLWKEYHSPLPDNYQLSSKWLHNHNLHPQDHLAHRSMIVCTRTKFRAKHYGYHTLVPYLQGSIGC